VKRRYGRDCGPEGEFAEAIAGLQADEVWVAASVGLFESSKSGPITFARSEVGGEKSKVLNESSTSSVPYSNGTESGLRSSILTMRLKGRLRFGTEESMTRESRASGFEEINQHVKQLLRTTDRYGKSRKLFSAGWCLILKREEPKRC
jgi:hypothetical protein